MEVKWLEVVHRQGLNQAVWPQRPHPQGTQQSCHSHKPGLAFFPQPEDEPGPRGDQRALHSVLEDAVCAGEGPDPTGIWGRAHW